MTASEYESMVNMLADHDIANLGWVQVGQDGQTWVWTGSRPESSDTATDPGAASPGSLQWATTEWSVLTYDMESMRKLGASNIQNIGSSRVTGTLGVRYVALSDTSDSGDEQQEQGSAPPNTGDGWNNPAGNPGGLTLALILLAAMGTLAAQQWAKERLKSAEAEGRDWDEWDAAAYQILTMGMGAVTKTPWGWTNSKPYREAVETLNEAKDHMDINKIVPTEQQAKELIKAGGGKIERVDHVGHASPNPHTYPHINYLTRSGHRASIRIQ